MPHPRRRDVAPAYLIRQAHVSAQGAHTKLSDKEGRLITLEQDKPLQDAKITALESSSVGIVDGGRANLQHVEATAINGGNASTT